MRTIATVGGVGYCPVAPGTAGSAVGLGIAWVLSPHPIHLALGCAAAIALGFWSAGPTARAMGDPDPSCVVIDETAGMMLSLLFLPAGWKIYLAAFVLFRLLDVLKPFPLRRLERLPGSWGIMLDDLTAGVAANLSLRLGLLFFR